MTKIVIITDTHFGARNDSAIFHNYFKKFYDNIFFPYLEKHNIETVFHLGDIVDRRKYINYVSLNKMKRDFFDKLRKLVPVSRNAPTTDTHILIGNHDVPYRNTNKINSMSELFASPYNPIRFYPEAQEIEIDGTKILLVPWINNSNYEKTMEVVRKSKAKILFGHLELNGFEMLRGIACDVGLDAKLFKKFDVVLSGHFHHRSTQGNITYLGAPYEITWADFNDPKGFHLFDTDTMKLQFIRNPYKMFYKLFYNDENKTVEYYRNKDYNEFKDTYIKVIVQKKTNPFWFDIFCEKIYDANPAHLSIIDSEMIRNINETEEQIIHDAEDTMAILRNYVDEIDVDVDKKGLHLVIRDLYNEAQHMDI